MPHSSDNDLSGGERERSERLRLALEQIAWMDEFLDKDGARAMMNIAREAINNDT
jgi:hypothetical protein